MVPISNMTSLIALKRGKSLKNIHTYKITYLPTYKQTWLEPVFHRLLDSGFAPSALSIRLNNALHLGLFIFIEPIIHKIKEICGVRVESRWSSHWRIQPSFFFWGGALWRRDQSQGTPKTKHSTDLGHYFLEGPKFTKKNKQIKNDPHLPPVRRSTKSSKLWKKLIFLCRRKCAFIMYEGWI